MKVNVEKQPKNTVKITVEISPEKIEPFLKTTAGQLSKNMNISGFRPGKAPYDMVKKQIGESAIYQEAAEEIIRKTYAQVVIEQKIEVIGRPKVEIQKMAAGNPFVYTAVASLLPRVTLGDYKNIKAKMKIVQVEKSEVDKIILQLRKMRAKETLADRPIKKGDKVDLNVDLSLDNVPIDGGQTKNQTLIIGDGQMVPGFEEQLIGLKKDDVKKFKQKYPKEYFHKPLAGKETDCRVKINSVFDVELPELNDDFVKTLGKFTTPAELEERIKKNIEAEKKQQEKQRYEIELLKEIISRSEFEEIPDILIEAELDRMIGELRLEVERQGFNFNDYLKQLKKTEAEMKNEFQNQANQRIKSALVLRQIRIQENITVDSNQIAENINRQKEMYKDDLETYNKVDSPEYRDQYEEMLLNRKVFDFLSKSSE